MATTSLIDQLTEVAADLVKDSRADAKPILKEGKRLAKAQSKAESKAASGKEKPKKKHRLRKLLLLTLLAGAGVAVAKKLRAGGPDWQSPAPGKHAAPEPHEADDASGASPDEALADAVDEPHPVTTPDSRAVVVDLDGADKS